MEEFCDNRFQVAVWGSQYIVGLQGRLKNMSGRSVCRGLSMQKYLTSIGHGVFFYTLEL